MKTNIGMILAELEGKEPEDDFPYEELDVLVEYLCTIVPVDPEDVDSNTPCPFADIDMNTMH